MDFACSHDRGTSWPTSKHARSYVLRTQFQFCFTVTAASLAGYLSAHTKVSWWPPGADDHELIVFLALVSILGGFTTVFGLIPLCFKYDANDFMSKTGHKFYGCNFIPVWLSLIYVAVSAGATFVSHGAPLLWITPCHSCSPSQS